LNDPERVKSVALDLGVDLCGIAPPERFESAPPGFHPADIYSDCRTVLVFAKRLPRAALTAKGCVVYTRVNAVVNVEVDLLTLELSRKLEAEGIGSVPVPSDDPYEHWEPERLYGRGILSLRHAGYLAGLGHLGKNTLLMNENLGNMIQIGAVLLDAAVEGDPIATYQVCPPGCTLCIDSCPVGALDGETVNQELCRPLSRYTNERGFILKKCNICRSVCPHATGIRKQEPAGHG
jgi:epoxyqueuosine reductase